MLIRVSAVVTATICSTTVIAQSYQGTGNVTGEMRLFGEYIYGESGEFTRTIDDSRTFANGTSGFDITLNSESSIIVFGLTTLTTPELTIIFSDNFTVGFGASIDVTTSIVVDTTTLEAVGVGPLNLAPGTEGVFDIEEIPYGFSPPVIFPDLFTMAVEYEVTGPAETVSGSFSALFAAVPTPRFPDLDLDTSSYPSSVMLVNDSTGAAFTGLSGPDFSATVDGVTFELDLTRLILNVEDVTLNAIPEPSCFALVICGIVCCKIWRA